MIRCAKQRLFSKKLGIFSHWKVKVQNHDFLLFALCCYFANGWWWWHDHLLFLSLSPVLQNMYYVAEGNLNMPQNACFAFYTNLIKSLRKILIQFTRSTQCSVCQCERLWKLHHGYHSETYDHNRCLYEHFSLSFSLAHWLAYSHSPFFTC